jgi:hypothetical protein
MATQSNPEQKSLQKYLKKKTSRNQAVVDINMINKMNEDKNSAVAKYLH